MQSTLKASYIIPFRSGDVVRGQNLLALLEWLKALPQLEIIVVEQDTAPTIQSSLKQAANSDLINHVFQPHSGHFNKSSAMNHGAALANSEILILADADMLIDHTALQLCIEACRDHADAVNPYTTLIDLTRQQRQEFLATGKLPLENCTALSQRQQEGEVLCFCGGIYLMKKKVYQQIGGMDTHFQGWGAEDDAMSIKLQKLSISQLIKHSQPAYHLWHQRNPQRYQHATYQANLALLKRYAAMTPQEMVEYCKVDIELGRN